MTALAVLWAWQHHAPTFHRLLGSLFSCHLALCSDSATEQTNHQLLTPRVHDLDNTCLLWQPLRLLTRPDSMNAAPLGFAFRSSHIQCMQRSLALLSGPWCGCVGLGQALFDRRAQQLLPHRGCCTHMAGYTLTVGAQLALGVLGRVYLSTAVVHTTPHSSGGWLAAGLVLDGAGVS